ncbi:MAG: glucose/sorbosone dehydrogenase, partial [candidate division WWE3 bacterium GW2011_GWD2_42_34]
GYFTTAGGVSVNYIAKYNDQTNQFSNIGQTTGVAGEVYAFAVYNGNLYVGGIFSTAGGVTVNYIAKYNDQTNQFSNIGQTTGVDGMVLDMTVLLYHGRRC